MVIDFRFNFVCLTDPKSPHSSPLTVKHEFGRIKAPLKNRTGYFANPKKRKPNQRASSRLKQNDCRKIRIDLCPTKTYYFFLRNYIDFIAQKTNTMVETL